MRRLMVIAAFALLLVVPVWAQHGGGHGGGGHGGFAGGGHSSFSGGGHSGSFGSHSFGGSHGSRFSGTHSATGYHRGIPMQSNRSRGPFLHDGFRGNGFNHFGPRRRGTCWAYGCGGWGYPWWGSAYYDPWYWDWAADDYSFDRDYDENLATANEMNRQSLEQQRMLRQEEAEGDQDAYNSRYPQHYRVDLNSGQNSPTEKAGSPIMPPTVLVFRDQRQEEIQNYAIIGQTLWNFAPQRTERISLATVDLPATVKANDDRGVTFRMPGLQSQ